jgi:hypothetical protein
MNTWHVLLSCCSIRAPRARWGPPEEWVPSSARRRFFSRRRTIDFRLVPSLPSLRLRRRSPLARSRAPGRPRDDPQHPGREDDERRVLLHEMRRVKREERDAHGGVGERRNLSNLRESVPYEAKSGWSSKASEGVERRRGRALKPWCGRRDAPGEKVLKDRRSPRRRGRMGTSVR